MSVPELISKDLRQSIPLNANDARQQEARILKGAQLTNLGN